jgi:hypothetical protein
MLVAVVATIAIVAAISRAQGATAIPQSVQARAIADLRADYNGRHVRVVRAERSTRGGTPVFIFVVSGSFEVQGPPKLSRSGSWLPSATRYSHGRLTVNRSGAELRVEFTHSRS